uniref:Uncharacterized protein n=1 Tax=Octactis speculum TaxID=3111310 RepID=A0A7S2GR86_9STRA
MSKQGITPLILSMPWHEFSLGCVLAYDRNGPDLEDSMNSKPEVPVVDVEVGESTYIPFTGLVCIGFRKLKCAQRWLSGDEVTEIVCHKRDRLFIQYLLVRKSNWQTPNRVMIYVYAIGA